MVKPFTLPTVLAVGILLVPAWLRSDAEAAEIRILSAAVMKPVLSVLAGEFEQTSGHKLTIEYVPAGAAKSRIEAGEMVDVAIIQRPAAKELAQQGKINLGGMKTLARSALAVAVRRGRTKPDIRTTEAFKRALLAAKSVSYPDPAEGHAAGILFRAIVDRLGIAEQIAAKAKLQKRPFSESPPEDQADLGIAQPSEIAHTPGFELLGLIPDDLQDYEWFSWTAAVTTNAREPKAAAMLIKFLSSSTAAMKMEKAGMDAGMGPGKF
jgi:molybdate transport system substrate-binding protein